MENYLTYKGYSSNIQFSAEDEVFYGKIQGINDLVSFEGNSVDKLKKAFQSAVDDYLETCKDEGKDPDKTFKGSFNVRVGAELHKKAAQIAGKKNISLNEFVKKAVAKAVANK